MACRSGEPGFGVWAAATRTAVQSKMIAPATGPRREASTLTANSFVKTLLWDAQSAGQETDKIVVLKLTSACFAARKYLMDLSPGWLGLIRRDFPQYLVGVSNDLAFALDGVTHDGFVFVSRFNTLSPGRICLSAPSAQWTEQNGLVMGRSLGERFHSESHSLIGTSISAFKRLRTPPLRPITPGFSHQIKATIRAVTNNDRSAII
jgi:hypothetical protein